MSSRKKLILLMLMDSLLVNAAVFFTFWTHYGSQLPFHKPWGYAVTAIVNAAVLVGSFYVSGLYKRLLQYFSTGELLSIIKAVTASTVGYAFGCQLVSGYPHSWNLWVQTWMTTVFLTGGSRLVWRVVQEIIFQCPGGTRLKSVLIIGAGDAGARVARALLDNKVGLLPVAFVDDAPEKQGMRLYGIPVLGSRQDVPRITSAYAIEEIVIAIPSASPAIVRELVSICRSTPARLKIVPSVVKLFSGPLTPEQIRDIQVEDLLQREPVHVNLEEIANYLHQQVVLITGAGGSIGSELCRQIAAFAPRLLVILGHGENSIYELNRELGEKYPDIPVKAEIGNVRDFRRMDTVFRKYRPGVVFHAAAHKHVPLMEDVPDEAFQNNVLGTLNITRAADLHGTKVFVFISTDKAVNPVSVMGTTKKVAEQIVKRMNETSQTKFVVVRFGNVLGSRGSVVPLFKRQIASGGPVTITHPDMSRYFMTVQEAAQLVIQAGAIAEGGETFVLDMGEPVKILELARALIDLTGMKDKIEIIYTGLRPGEKLNEELFTTEEGSSVTRHKRIFITQTRQEAPGIIDDLINGTEPKVPLGPQEALKLLQALVPTFRKSCN